MREELYTKRALDLKPKETKYLDLVRSLGRLVVQVQTQDTQSVRNAEEGEEFLSVFS
jgi:hypothetical protein